MCAAGFPSASESMMFVVVRHVRSDAGRPSRFTVKISSRPSRTLAAASGQSRWSHEAYWSSLRMPSLASSFQAARRVARAWSCCAFGRWPTTFRSLWLRQRCTSLPAPNTWAIALRSAFAPSTTNSRRRSGRIPRATRSSAGRSSRSRSQRHRCARRARYFFPSSSTPTAARTWWFPNWIPSR